MLGPVLSGRITRKMVNDLVQNRLTADPGATYAKSFYCDLSVRIP